MILWKSGLLAQIGSIENSFLFELFNTDQEMVAGSRREALERRITVAGRIQRKHLPPFLSGLSQKIDESECF